MQVNERSLPMPRYMLRFWNILLEKKPKKTPSYLVQSSDISNGDPLHQLECAFSSNRYYNITQCLGDEAGLTVRKVVLPRVRNISTCALICGIPTSHFLLNTSTPSLDISGCSLRSAGLIFMSKFPRKFSFHSLSALA